MIDALSKENTASRCKEKDRKYEDSPDKKLGINNGGATIAMQLYV
jgi:hypothetical protein